MAWLLAACGGGGGGSADEAPGPATTIANRLLLWPSDTRRADERWATLSMLPTYGLTPEQSVAAQSAMPGRLILWPDNPKRNGFGHFREFVDLAAAEPRFEYAYVYDELFWTGTEDSIGWQEDEMLAAAAYARSRGLKPLVAISPCTVLNPAFALRDANAIDVIAVDVYPSVVISEDTGECRYDDNLTTNLLYCSERKLRKMGFRGEVWYVYQAFGMKTEDPARTLALLQAQRRTIELAASLGITGIVPFGLYLGAEELVREPYLVPGKGSPFEWLVQP